MSKKRTEESALEEQFRALEIQRRHRFFRTFRPGNQFTTILTEAFMATGESIFLKAMEVGSRYGFNEGQAVRSIRRVGALRESARAVSAVDAELRRQQEANEPRSFRKAYGRAALQTGIEAPTFGAARKRVEKTYKAKAVGTIPDGDTGREVLVGPCEIVELPDGSSVAGKATWHPDNCETRQMVGKKAYVVFSSRLRPGTASFDSFSLVQGAAIFRHILRGLPTHTFNAMGTREVMAGVFLELQGIIETLPGWKARLPPEFLTQIEQARDLARWIVASKDSDRGPLWRARRRPKVGTAPTASGTKAR